jgi:hypothetical protein
MRQVRMFDFSWTRETEAGKNLHIFGKDLEIRTF